jgi:hypothetical protein
VNDIVCIGACNRRWRDAELAYQRAYKNWENTDLGERDTKPEHHSVRPVPGNPVWCVRCASGIKVSLAELDDLAALYAAEADGHRTAPGTEPVSGSKSRRSPSPAADDIDELYSVLHGWETAYRGEDPQARRGYLADNITTVVAWLVEHFDGVIAHEGIAADFGQDVRRWHKSLREKTRSGTGKHTKPLPCARCDLKTLTWVDGERYVECENCGRLMTLDEYDDYARMMAPARLMEAS